MATHYGKVLILGKSAIVPWGDRGGESPVSGLIACYPRVGTVTESDGLIILSEGNNSSLYVKFP